VALDTPASRATSWIVGRFAICLTKTHHALAG
jgi:hypothetical protein